MITDAPTARPKEGHASILAISIAMHCFFACNPNQLPNLSMLQNLQSTCQRA